MTLSSILANFKIEALNSMQQETIDAFKTTKDLILISPTGSGKTLAFLLPII